MASSDEFSKYDPAQRAYPEPYPAFRFSISIAGDGQDWLAGFTDATGLDVESVVETFRAGGENDAERQLVGATKYPGRLTLKHGMADQDHLWDWYRQVRSGEIARRDVTVQMLSNDGEDAMYWTFLKACPVKWTGPELHAATSAIAFESIELVHQGVLPY